MPQKTKKPIQALDDLLQQIDEITAPLALTRFVYVWEEVSSFDYDEEDGESCLRPYLQKMGKAGWSKPRRVSWANLIKNGHSEIDKRIINALMPGVTNGIIDWRKAFIDRIEGFRILQGTGLLLNESFEPLQVAVRPIELTFSQGPGGNWLHFEQPLPNDRMSYLDVLESWEEEPYWPFSIDDVVFTGMSQEYELLRDNSMAMIFSQEQEDEDLQMTILLISPQQQALSKLIGPHGIHIPAKWNDRMPELLKALEAIGPVNCVLVD